MVLKEHALLHLAILGEREFYCVVAKNYQTEAVLTEWLRQGDVIPSVEKLNLEGYVCWVSLNDKEKGQDTIKGTATLQDFWLDFDAARKDKTVAATEQEKQDALEQAVAMETILSKDYGAMAFTAASGNGFHLHCPLPRFEMPGEKFREQVNEKVRAFAKKAAARAGATIDSTYDIRRVTTLVGSPNLKIPEKPLETKWRTSLLENGLDYAVQLVERARSQNKGLLEAILNTEISKLAAPRLAKRSSFEDLLRRNQKLEDLYRGNWTKHGYKSRSEAEEALLVMLVGYGFSDPEIKAVMEGCQIGKWQERDDSYRNHSIETAREYVLANPKKEPPIVEEIRGQPVFKELIQTLCSTVKLDYVAKQMDVLHLTSAYSNPMNMLKDAPTSEGKTYPTLQAARMLPSDDVLILGGLSPTALAHDYGVPVDEKGNSLLPKFQEIDEKVRALKKEKIGAAKGGKQAIGVQIEELEDERKELWANSSRLIDMENKIIIFVENPHPETWARLRPIMSHDAWEIVYKFTDKAGARGPLRQFTAIIRGWPVFVAFKAEAENPRIWDQVLTRGTNVPVEMSELKYRQAIKLEALRKGLPQFVVNHKLRKDKFDRAQLIIGAVKAKLLELKEKARQQSGADQVPNLFWMPFYRKIGRGFPAEVGMHMRESERFLGVIQMHAAINVYARPVLHVNGAEYIICTLEDYAKGVELYFSDEAKKVIFSKLPKKKVDFFEKVLVPLWKEKNPKSTDSPAGLTTDDMCKKSGEVFKNKLSQNTINFHYLKTLEGEPYNLITREQDPSNKSRLLTFLLREEFFEEKTPIETQFENGDVITLREVKNAYNEVNQVVCFTPHDIYIRNFDGRHLTLEELHEKYFYYTPALKHTTQKRSKQTAKPTSKPNGDPIPKGVPVGVSFDSLTLLFPPEKGQCKNCEKQGVTLYWEARTVSGETFKLCEGCGREVERRQKVSE